jgi:hypothetical protein
VRSTSRALGLMGVAAVLVACTDYAGPIPGTEQTEQTTESNVPSMGGAGTDTPAPGAGGGDTAGAGSGEMPAGNELLTFDRDVHPILVAKCGTCHEGAAPALPDHGASDVDVAFAATQGMSNDEPVFVRILARAAGEDGFMPPSCAGPLGAAGCLTEEEFEIIELWVEQGASNR